MSPNSNVGSDSGAINPLKLLHFEISDHEILKREDYVVSISDYFFSLVPIFIVFFNRFLIIFMRLSPKLKQVSNIDTVNIIFVFMKVYFLRIKTVTKSVASWTKTVSLRYNNFKELHAKVS